MVKATDEIKFHVKEMGEILSFIYLAFVALITQPKRTIVLLLKVKV